MSPLSQSTCTRTPRSWKPNLSRHTLTCSPPLISSPTVIFRRSISCLGSHNAQYATHCWSRSLHLTSLWSCPNNTRNGQKRSSINACCLRDPSSRLPLLAVAMILCSSPRSVLRSHGRWWHWELWRLSVNTNKASTWLWKQNWEPSNQYLTKWCKLSSHLKLAKFKLRGSLKVIYWTYFCSYRGDHWV